MFCYYNCFLFFSFLVNIDLFFVIDIMYLVFLYIYFGIGKIDIYIFLIKMNFLKVFGVILEYYSVKFICMKIF